MNIKIKKTKSGLSSQLTRDIRFIQGVPQEAHRKFVEVTPIDKGNARKNTRLNQNTIVANYPYADRLNKGWSRQAPKGMSLPTLIHIKKYIKKLLGK